MGIRGPNSTAGEFVTGMRTDLRRMYANGRMDTSEALLPLFIYFGLAEARRGGSYTSMLRAG